MITSEDVLGVLGQVMHPEMKRSLVELGMITDDQLKIALEKQAE